MGKGRARRWVLAAWSLAASCACAALAPGCSSADDQPAPDAADAGDASADASAAADANDDANDASAETDGAPPCAFCALGAITCDDATGPQPTGVDGGFVESQSGSVTAYDATGCDLAIGTWVSPVRVTCSPAAFGASDAGVTLDERCVHWSDPQGIREVCCH